MDSSSVAGQQFRMRRLSSRRDPTREHQPGVVFLDVQMPGIDGFGVVEAIGAERMPVVIFVTAFDNHALKAFEAHAFDYLLKPIDDVRFATTIERARHRVVEREESGVAVSYTHLTLPTSDL